MNKKIIAISLTTKGAQVFKNSLQDYDYLGAEPNIFNNGLQLWESKQIIAKNDEGMIIRFYGLPSGWNDVLAIKSALKELKATGYPYQIITRNDDEINYDAFDGYQIESNVPSEHLPFNLSHDNDNKIQDNTTVDIALKQVEAGEALTALDIINLLNKINDTKFEPITIDADYHECSAMGFASQNLMTILMYNTSDLTHFISNILDDTEKETPDGIYQYHMKDPDITINISMQY